MDEERGVAHGSVYYSCCASHQMAPHVH